MKTICGGCNKLIPLGTICQCKKTQRKQYAKDYAKRNPEKIKIIRSGKWRTFRKRIIQRDGGHCQRCLIKYNLITTSNLEVHHIKPRDKYPELTYEEENCITLCQTCNLQLGTQEALDFPFKAETTDDFVL
ncbi:HNH endonuclease [Priestia aryabhattai]|uniref:HNH endonuclease n=1 Tax=Priestia aryabhattai TaxID=412384 RepID=UPI002E216405|nr:HNH endonuclease signature motif containing protein [Priestia aryabhattai]